MANINVKHIYEVNGVLSSDEIVWEIPIQSTVDNPNSFLELSYPSDFTFKTADITSVNPSTYDDTLKRWDVSLVANELAVLKLTLEFTPPATLEELYSFLANVNGLDTNPLNNDFSETITYKKVVTQPLGNANDDTLGAVFVDVSKNDTQCSEGDTVWKLNESSIVNGELISWDETLGQGYFKYSYDITSPITFTYDMVCMFGEDEYVISENTTVTVDALTTSYPDNVIGYLCDSNGSVVFAKQVGDNITYTLPDNTQFNGDVNTLSDCGCSECITNNLELNNLIVGPSNDNANYYLIIENGKILVKEHPPVGPFMSIVEASSDPVVQTGRRFYLDPNNSEFIPSLGIHGPFYQIQTLN